MYLCYVDESGLPDPEATGKYFILVGLALPIDKWSHLNSSVLTIMEKYDLQGTELHATKINDFINFRRTTPDLNEPNLTYLQRRQLSEKWWKTYLANNRVKKPEEYEPFFHLSKGQCASFLNEITQLVSSKQLLTIFVEIVDKTFVQERFPSQVVDLAFIHLVHKFELFLNNHDSYGIVVQDASIKESHARLAGIMSTYHDERTSLGQDLINIQRIVDAPFFVDSQLHVGIQLADVCSWSTYRYFNTGREDYYFKNIFDRFYKHDGRLVGATHHVANPNCRCKICQENRNQN